jgi:hypothetical protein
LNGNGISLDVLRVSLYCFFTDTFVFKAAAIDTSRVCDCNFHITISMSFWLFERLFHGQPLLFQFLQFFSCSAILAH